MKELHPQLEFSGFQLWVNFDTVGFKVQGFFLGFLGIGCRTCMNVGSRMYVCMYVWMYVGQLHVFVFV